jgi:hypothetical protein
MTKYLQQVGYLFIQRKREGDKAGLRTLHPLEAKNEYSGMCDAGNQSDDE